MIIVLFVILHWYASLFFQSIFHHRYAAHSLFTMSKFTEKLFYIGCAITQGSSYLSASTYGIMHRLHHANADTEDDPHSPKYSSNVFSLMWQTWVSYFAIASGKTKVEDKYKKDLPHWDSFDRIVNSWIVRLLWVFAYIAFYIAFATHWWLFLLLPLNIIMGPLQGIAINYWAHKFGYVNFKMQNTSKNILPVDLIFWGEAYHNNHHEYPGRANFGTRWFELDPGYIMTRLMNTLGIIKLKAISAKA